MPKYYDASTRAQVIALRDFGATIKEVVARTGVQERTQRKIIQRAKERGFTTGGLLLDEHVEDGKKSGAPLKRTQSFEEEVAEKVRKDRYSREKTTEQMAAEFKEGGRDISARSVHSTLKAMGFNYCKPSKKPGLTSLRDVM
jgi:transposase